MVRVVCQSLTFPQIPGEISDLKCVTLNFKLNRKHFLIRLTHAAQIRHILQNMKDNWQWIKNNFNYWGI